MIDITANEGDPRSIVISYGPMPEGSDAFMEASDTYDELIGELGRMDHNVTVVANYSAMLEFRAKVASALGLAGFWEG